MNREENRKKVLEYLEHLDISYEIYEHPPLDTIEIALKYWKDIDATHCKNLFFRNHKGNRHYLVIIKDTTPFDIHSLEKMLHQGKLSFASEKRMIKYLGVLFLSLDSLMIKNIMFMFFLTSSCKKLKK